MAPLTSGVLLLCTNGKYVRWFSMKDTENPDSNGLDDDILVDISIIKIPM